MADEKPKVIRASDELPQKERDDGAKAEAPDPPTNAQETIGKDGDEG